MAQDIYLCFECGKRNRVLPDADRSRAKCGACKAGLFPGETKTPTPRSRKKYAPRDTSNLERSDGRKSTIKPKTVAWIAMVCVIAAIAIAAESNNEEHSRRPAKSQTGQRTTSAATSTTAPLPPAVFQVPGLVYNTTGIKGSHPFEIVTSPGRDYFVKLVDSVTGQDRIGIFVRGGMRTEVEVPAGHYQMRYASGETWRGLQHLFGPGSLTYYQASSEVFDFSTSAGYYNGYTVELIQQVGGNLDTHAISGASF